MPIIRQRFKTAFDLPTYKEVFKFYAFVNDSVVWLFKQTVEMSPTKLFLDSHLIQKWFIKTLQIQMFWPEK